MTQVCSVFGMMQLLLQFNAYGMSKIRVQFDSNIRCSWLHPTIFGHYETTNIKYCFITWERSCGFTITFTCLKQNSYLYQVMRYIKTLLIYYLHTYITESSGLHVVGYLSLHADGHLHQTTVAYSTCTWVGREVNLCAAISLSCENSIVLLQNQDQSES